MHENIGHTSTLGKFRATDLHFRGYTLDGVRRVLRRSGGPESLISIGQASGVI